MNSNIVHSPNYINIDGNLRLRTIIEEDYKLALPWYKNPKILYYSEGVTNRSYDLEIINKMYSYLKSIGEVYFIEILENNTWKAIGDAALSEENMPIVIGEEIYWGTGIGTKVIATLIKRAKYLNLRKISISIYKYNERSKNLFTSFGFIKTYDDHELDYYELKLN